MMYKLNLMVYKFKYLKNGPLIYLKISTIIIWINKLLMETIGLNSHAEIKYKYVSLNIYYNIYNIIVCVYYYKHYRKYKFMVCKHFSFGWKYIIRNYYFVI